jgi:hypothetical protein
VKLEGSLDAFSLPDIFQLLSMTKKTGALRLRSGAAEGVVHFAGGAVTGASADARRQSLARRLVGSGAVNDEALRAAVDAVISAGGSLGVGRALRDAGAVEPELLQAAATEQAVDAVFDLLRWESGDFAFDVDQPNTDDVGVALPTDRVVAEAESRAADWAGLDESVISPEVVLAMPVVLAQDPVATRDEWALLALVDGRRTIADLVDLTGCGQFAVVATLARLVDRGLLEPRDRRGDHVQSVERRHQLLAPLEGRAAAPAAASETPVAEARETAPLLGGAHVPADVVPPRPEPFLQPRTPDHPDGTPMPQSPAVAQAPSVPTAPTSAPSPAAVEAPGPRPVSSPTGGSANPWGSTGMGSGGMVMGTAAVAEDPNSLIERDPSVNRSLLLRLIAGVRGL